MEHAERKARPRKVKRLPVGIVERHSRQCRGYVVDGTCSCHPSYRAWVWDKRTNSKIFKTFPTLAAAKSWRHDAVGAVARKKLQPPSQLRLNEAAEDWLAGAKRGAFRTRSGDIFKPSTLHGYEQVLRARVLPVLGGARLSDLSRADLQRFAEDMLAEGKDSSTVRNALMPLRAILRRAVDLGELPTNPTTGLRLPAVRGRRDRIVSAAEASRLLSELPEGDRALWSTALYAGLRRGELMALRWKDVDLDAGVIHVARSYDPRSGLVGAPKSSAGNRRVPIASALRSRMAAHKLRCPWSNNPEGLVFGRDESTPFNHTSVMRRAESAWWGAEAARLRAAGEEEDATRLRAAFELPLRLHEARHTFASLMIAAGVNAKSLSTYLGHSSISITLDRYGHLMPGNEGEAAELLDSYLEREAVKAEAQMPRPQ